jgi:hypothetical protein
VVDRAETREVAIERDDLAPVLHSHCCDHSVCDQVPGRIGLVAQAAEEREVTRSGTHREMQRLIARGIYERERFRTGRRDLEDPAIGG